MVTAKELKHSCTPDMNIDATDNQRNCGMRHNSVMPSRACCRALPPCGVRSSSQLARTHCNAAIISSAKIITSISAHFQPHSKVTGGATSAMIIQPAGTQVCLIENTRLRRLGGLKRNNTCAPAGVITLIAAPSNIEAITSAMKPLIIANASATTLNSKPAWIARQAPWRVTIQVRNGDDSIAAP